MPRNPAQDDKIRLLESLGLSERAPVTEWERAGRTLGAHICARRDQSYDPAFRAARQAELELLEQSLERAKFAATKPRRRRPSPHLLWLALLGLAVFAGIRFGLADRATASHPQIASAPATLSVLSDPQGASFVLFDPSDDSVLAHEVADGRRTQWPAGEYRIRVEHSDCPDDWNQHVSLPAGSSKSYAPKLCQGEGQLIVQSNQNESRVRIDDRDVGGPGETSHPLRTGKHRVTVEKNGFSPWQAEIIMEPDQSLTLHADLTPIEGGSTAPPTTNARDATPTTAAVAPPLPTEEPLAGASADVPGALPQATGGGTSGAGRGGSKTWHDAVKQELVRTYDRNGSRSLDSSDEIRAIPCAVWLNIEAQYETGGLAVDMTHLYGFDGSDAPANTLGVTYGLRGETYQRMKECGLKTRL